MSVATVQEYWGKQGTSISPVSALHTKPHAIRTSMSSVVLAWYNAFRMLPPADQGQTAATLILRLTGLLLIYMQLKVQKGFVLDGGPHCPAQIPIQKVGNARLTLCSAVCNLPIDASCKSCCAN